MNTKRAWGWSATERDRTDRAARITLHRIALQNVTWHDEQIERLAAEAEARRKTAASRVMEEDAEDRVRIEQRNYMRFTERIAGSDFEPRRSRRSSTRSTSTATATSRRVVIVVVVVVVAPAASRAVSRAGRRSRLYYLDFGARSS